MKVIFTSKDEILAQYYEECFGDWFSREVVQLYKISDVPRRVMTEYIEEVWKPRMLCEARIQEHYDYTTDEDGHRHLVYEKDGQPRLMIPEVKVER